MIKILLLILLWMLLHGVSASQENIAIVPMAVYDRVEIRRANTSLWLHLRPEMDVPFGPGDMLRTDNTGRALLNFAGKFEALLLPNSTFSLENFALSAEEQVRFAARLSGHLIQRANGETEFEQYQLVTDRLTLVSAPLNFAVWDQDGQLAAVTIAEGSGSIRVNEQIFTLEAEEGLLVDLEGWAVSGSMSPPLNAARLEGILFGCPGQINTVDGVNVNVRVGPGLDFTVVGNIADQQPVQIMGVNRGGTWYRIQAFSGFGWQRANLIEADCPDAPLISGRAVELNVGIFGITPDELLLLAPFYGPPEEDLWFYRSFSE